MTERNESRRNPSHEEMQNIPGLTREQAWAIRDTLTEWAEENSDPLRPILSDMNGNIFNIKDIAGAVQDPKSELGRHMYEMFSASLEAGDELEDILADFREPEFDELAARPKPNLPKSE